jgi:hypothetical protein
MAAVLARCVEYWVRTRAVAVHNNLPAVLATNDQQTDSPTDKNEPMTSWLLACTDIVKKLDASEPQMPSSNTSKKFYF